MLFSYIMLAIACIRPRNLAHCKFMEVPYQRYPVCFNGYTNALSKNSVLIPSIVVFFISLLTLACSKSARQSNPLNYILILAFSFSMGVFWIRCLGSFISAIVLLTIGIPTVSFLGLMCATTQNQRKPTSCVRFGIGLLVAIALQLVICIAMVMSGLVGYFALMWAFLMCLAVTYCYSVCWVALVKFVVPKKFELNDYIHWGFILYAAILFLPLAILYCFLAICSGLSRRWIWCF